MPPEAIVLISVAGMLAFFSVPIAWILTAHQRKMALIIHGNQRDQSAANNEAVSSEIRELRQVVIQQAIALDTLTSEVRKTLPRQTQSESLPNRLGQDTSAT